MLTPFPQVDLDNPLLQQLFIEFEASVLADGGLEDEDRVIKKLFAKHAKLPHIRRVASELMTETWALGKTKDEVAEAVGIERTRLGDAILHGEMALDTYLALRFSIERPHDLKLSSRERDLCNRSGFIAVAKHLASLVPNRPQLVPSVLDELHHELLCACFRNYAEWMLARVRMNASFAAELVKAVCADVSVDVLVTWNTDADRERVQETMKRLQETKTAAFDYLRPLLEAWQDVYVAAAHGTELIRWR